MDKKTHLFFIFSFIFSFILLSFVVSLKQPPLQKNEHPNSNYPTRRTKTIVFQHINKKWFEKINPYPTPSQNKNSVEEKIFQNTANLMNFTLSKKLNPNAIVTSVYGTTFTDEKFFNDKLAYLISKSPPEKHFLKRIHIQFENKDYIVVEFNNKGKIIEIGIFD